MISNLLISHLTLEYERGHKKKYSHYSLLLLASVPQDKKPYLVQDSLFFGNHKVSTI